jgi:FkbM family methyltransferase
MNDVVDFKGIQISCRPNSTDKNIAIGIIGIGDIFSDEYHIRKLAKRGDVFVDIGAYAGHASLLAAQLGMNCLALEPLPDNLSNLRENLNLNPDLAKRIKVVEAAIGGNKLYWNDQSTSFSTTHRFIAQNKPTPNATEVEVPIVELDMFLADYECIHLLKTDCEGGEWAIAHAPDVQRKICYIVGEFHKLDERTFDNFRSCFPHHDDVSAEFGDGNSVDGINQLFVFKLDTI